MGEMRVVEMGGIDLDVSVRVMEEVGVEDFVVSVLESLRWSCPYEVDSRGCMTDVVVFLRLHAIGVTVSYARRHAVCFFTAFSYLHLVQSLRVLLLELIQMRRVKEKAK
jgi:hypothetical protein